MTHDLNEDVALLQSWTGHRPHLWCNRARPVGEMCQHEDVSEEMPSPPVPDPDSLGFHLIVARAIEALRMGEATVEQAILSAAVRGLYEGRIQGEGACPGCDYSGQLRKQTHMG